MSKSVKQRMRSLVSKLLCEAQKRDSVSKGKKNWGTRLTEPYTRRAIARPATAPTHVQVEDKGNGGSGSKLKVDKLTGQQVNK